VATRTRQYFAYLRRNANDAPDNDYSGFDFWLNKLNLFNGNLDGRRHSSPLANIGSDSVRERPLNQSLLVLPYA